MIDNKKFYVYVHLTPDMTPFYVGKGNGDRATTFAPSIRNKKHAAIVAQIGARNVIIETMQCQSEAEALFREGLVLHSLRAAGVKLANIGGAGLGKTGSKHTEESKAKIRARIALYWANPENRERAAALMRGRKHRLGNVHSEEWKKRNSELSKGRRHSPEAIEKIRAAATKQWQDPTVREKHAIAVERMKGQ